MSSATTAKMLLPSSPQRGCETPRSSASLAATRCGGVAPSAATIARCSMPYASYFFSSPSRNAIHLPSGLNSGLPRPPRLAIGRQRLLGRLFLRVDDEELRGRLAIRILVSVAHEGDARAVGRPGRRRFVGLPLRQPIELLRRDVEQVDVAVAVREQVALAVLLVLVAIDDDRLRRFPRPPPPLVASDRRVASARRQDPDRR